MFKLENLFHLPSSTRFEFINLGFMLLLLQLALNQSAENHFLVAALLLSHIGFFLLWHPSLNVDSAVNIKTLLSIFILNSILFFIMGYWFIALWIILLIGLTSGSALVNGMQRTLYAIATIILFLQLSLVLTPKIFQTHTLAPEINEIIFYVLCIASITIIFWPVRKKRSVKIDYIHSLLISFGLFSFYITGMLMSYTANIHYLQALLITALCIALFFMLISIFGLARYGIAQLWEQHILNIGNPFENWVKHSSLLGQSKKITPELFLKKSIENLLTLSWVSGIFWCNTKESRLYGEISHQLTIFEDNEIQIKLYSHIPMAPALKIHAQLLLRLMSFFYQSKLREISLKNQTHLKAVYETGSMLTHDIKNILQSLQALTGVVNASDDPAESHLLLCKQLPVLTQRLQNTLDKLQTKTDTGKNFKSLDIWWTELQSRYHGRGIQFNGETTENVQIDSDVFNTVLENFLENARSKRRTQPDIEIITTIQKQTRKIVITVCDNGEPLADSLSSILFTQILPSKNGYGIGLYQSAQIAQRNGYKLSLVKNKPAHVCFQLAEN